MGLREQYEAKKAAHTRRAQEKGPKPWWWFGQPEPIARFTKWLAIYTFFLFVATVFSGVILWKTDKTLTDTAQKQLRAYLVIDVEHLDPEPGQKLRATLVTTNVGNTPAYGVRGRTLLAMFDYPFPGGRFPIIFSKNPGATDFLISGTPKTPTTIGAGRHIYSQGETIVPLGPDDLTNPKKRAVLAAAVYYRDVFDIDHYTRFCTVFTQSREYATSCSGPNDSN